MSDLRQLQDQLRRQRVEAARQRHPLDKALAGAELYDLVRDNMAWGVKMEFPDADEATLERLVLERMEENRKRRRGREDH